MRNRLVARLGSVMEGSRCQVKELELYFWQKRLLRFLDQATCGSRREITQVGPELVLMREKVGT